MQFKSHAATLSGKELKFLIADLLFANGELDRSERLYEELLSQSPGDPIILGSLGTVVLQKGERQKAVEYWREAIDHGITDAALCYRYALLADDMNLPAEQQERALRRAIENRTNFDDARYRLALLESNTGQILGCCPRTATDVAAEPEPRLRILGRVGECFVGRREA